MRRGPSGAGAAVALAAALVALGALLASPAAGQELEPRAYSPAPVGSNFLLLGYLRSTGSVVTDPSLPLQNVEAEVDAASLAYGRTFGLAGKLASVAIAVPYVRGTVTGDVVETSRRADRSGLADARLRFAWNPFGSPALTPGEFARRTPSTIVGTSLTLVAPTGQYDPDKLINLGANRWAAKPEIGVSYPAGRWTLELYGGAWFFETNDDFFGGQTREQEPIATLQGHVAYTFRPRLWAAIDATWYRGGETTVDGVPGRDLQENSRLGLTASLPLRGSRSLKLAWTKGVSTRIGGDFETYQIGFQQFWIDQGD